MSNPVFLPAPQPLTESTVLASIHALWNMSIFTFEKLVEIRKNRPLLRTPFKVLVYSTKPSRYDLSLCIVTWEGQKVLALYDRNKTDRARYLGLERLQVLDGTIIGEFVCDRITEFQVFDNGSVQNWNFAELNRSMLSYEDLAGYIGRGNKGYAWHITEPKLYENPVQLADAQKIFGLEKQIARAPQSWCYMRPAGGLRQG